MAEDQRGGGGKEKRSKGEGKRREQSERIGGRKQERRAERKGEGMERGSERSSAKQNTRGSEMNGESKNPKISYLGSKVLDLQHFGVYPP